MAPSMRTDVHAFANPEGLGTGRDVVVALRASVATSSVAFAVKATEEREENVGDGVTNDETSGRWSVGKAGEQNLVVHPALMMASVLGYSTKSAAPPAKLVNGTRKG